MRHLEVSDHGPRGIVFEETLAQTLARWKAITLKAPIVVEVAAGLARKIISLEWR